MEINPDYALPSTFALVIYTFIFFASKKGHGRRFITTIAVVGAILDWIPVFRGMINTVTPLGVVHGVITSFAYFVFIAWLITWDGKLYRTFYFTWLIAYALGYLA